LKTNHVLIDYENVQVKSLERLRAEHFRIYVFLGPSNMKLHKDLVLAMHEFGERAQYVELEVSAKTRWTFTWPTSWASCRPPTPRATFT
jgi:hypothetical protein